MSSMAHRLSPSSSTADLSGIGVAQLSNTTSTTYATTAEASLPAYVLPEPAVSSLPPRRLRRNTPATMPSTFRAQDDVIDLTDSPPLQPTLALPRRLVRARSRGSSTPAQSQIIDLDEEPDVRDIPASIPAASVSRTTTSSEYGTARGPAFPLPRRGQNQSGVSGADVRPQGTGVGPEAAAQLLRALETNRALASRHALRRNIQPGARTPYRIPVRVTSGNREPALRRNQPGRRGARHAFHNDHMNQVFAFFGYPHDAEHGSAAEGDHGTARPNVTGYVTTPYGGGPVRLPAHGHRPEGQAANAVLNMMQAGRFVPPNLDYGLYARAASFADRLFGVVGGPVASPEPMDKVDPPEPCKEPFTRTFSKADYLVCPDCHVELGSGEDEQKRKIWFTKCGHVYCGACATKIRTTKFGKGKGRSCAAPECTKALTKAKLFEAYL